MQYIFIILIFFTSLNADDYIVDGKLQTFTLPDQFEKTHTIDNSIHTIIVSFENSTGKEMNAFLSKQKPDYLQKHHAVFIANISKAPSLIIKYFIMPKMRKSKYPILLINDEDNHQFLYKEDKITVYTISNGVVSSIDYVDSAKDIEQLRM